jgi:hypothetical protein
MHKGWSLEKEISDFGEESKETIHIQPWHCDVWHIKGRRNDKHKSSHITTKML